MALSYQKVKQHPHIFLRLFGVTPTELENILLKVTPAWEHKVLKKYKRPGRHYKLALEELLMLLLLYYRSYSTQIQIGFMFGIDDSNVCRIIRKLEPIVAKAMAISKNRILTQEALTLLVDVTEQAIERPRKGQRAFYSGKKRRHTIKTEIRITPEGKICDVSKSHKGSRHDFALHKQGAKLPLGCRVYADSGYQGLKKLHARSRTPFKKTRLKPLTPRKKAYNKAIARQRIKIENIFAQIKRFRILSERYRNKRLRYNLKFNIIAGIVNMKNGFMAAA